MTTPAFLILRGGAIGDFICTLPALAALRRRWPQSRIHLVGYPGVGRLARACGLVDTMASLDRSEIAGLFVEDTPLSAFQRQMAASCDVALSYLHDPLGAVCRNLERADVPRVLHGSPLVTEGHAIDWLMQPLRAIQIFGNGTEAAHLDVPAAVATDAARRLPPSGRAPWIFLHPGSGNPDKNWPPDRFATLAQRIQRQSAATPVFLIGEADRAAAQTLARAAPDIPVIEPPDLVILAGLLSAGAGYIGNDSGVTHLAAAVGLPVLALFGPSDPERWAPRNRAVRVLRAGVREGGLPGLSLATVWAAWQSMTLPPEGTP